MTVREFEVDHVPHRAVFFHTPIEAAAVDTYMPVLRDIAQAENDIMGGPPYARYDFLFDVGKKGRNEVASPDGGRNRGWG